MARSKELFNESEIKREKDLRFDSIGERWRPKQETLPCICGGNLVYGHKPYSAGLSDRNLYISKLYGYYSDNDDCHAWSLLPQTDEEMSIRISEGLGEITHEEAEAEINTLANHE